MLENNLKIIKKRFPKIYEQVNKISDCRFDVEYINGYLKIENLTCFSKYNPENEAIKLIERWRNLNKNAKNVIVLGISNPFVLRELIKNYKVSILIPDLGLFKRLISILDFTEILENIDYLINDFYPVYENFSLFSLKIEEKLFPEVINKVKNFYKKTFYKVVFVKPIYGGSLPIANYIIRNLNKFNIKLKIIESEVFYNVLNFLKKNFVIKNFYSKCMENLLNFISEIIFYTIEEFKPDILFGVAQSPINHKILNYCKDKGILKIFWFMEDYKLFTYWKEFAPYYDYYFVIQKDNFFKELKRIGVKNYYYLPVAAEPTIHKPVKLSKEEEKYYGSTLSFVGAGYYNRRIFFRNLLNYDFKIWGSDWEGETVLNELIQQNGRRVSPEEYVKIFNASLININLHSSTYFPGIDPEGDFVNPRTFEISATNSIQVVDRRKYLPELYKEGEEILVYSSIQELKSLIDDIIKNPDKYKKIAEKGYLKTLENHTYLHRIKEMFSLVGINLKSFDFLDDNEDFYFFKFNSVDEIAECIMNKKKISFNDKIFLLMKSLKDTYLK